MRDMRPMDPTLWSDAARLHLEQRLPMRYERLRRAGTLGSEIASAVAQMRDAMLASFYDDESWEDAWERHSHHLYPDDIDDDLPVSERYEAAEELDRSLRTLRMPGEKDD